MNKISKVLEETKEENPLEEWNYYIVFIKEKNENEGSVVHAVGYKKLPSVKSLKHLFKELKTDPEFGIGEEIDDLKVDIVLKDYFIKQLEKGEENE